MCLVVEVMPGLSRTVCQYIRNTTGPPHYAAGSGAQGASTQRPPPTQMNPDSSVEAATQSEELERSRLIALQKLAQQMLLANAPVGAIYTGADLLVFERNFDHDLSLLEAINTRDEAPSSPSLRPGTAPPRLQYPPQLRPSLSLMAWDVSFSHPFAPSSANVDASFRSDNPTWCFSALLAYAATRLAARPRPLTAWNPSALCIWRLRRSVVDLLDVLTISQDGAADAERAQASTSTQLTSGLLVAYGQTLGPKAQTCLLLCSAVDPSRGRTGSAYHGKVYLSDDPLPPWSHWELTARHASSDASSQPGRPNFLYHAKGDVAAELARRAEALKDATITKHDVVLKLPNLTMAPTKESPGDLERGLCYRCARDMYPDETCFEMNAKLAVGFDQEEAMFARVRKGKHLKRSLDVLATPLCSLKLACQASARWTDAAWPQFSRNYAWRGVLCAARRRRLPCRLGKVLAQGRGNGQARITQQAPQVAAVRSHRYGSAA